MDVVRDLARTGAREGTWVRARVQTRGRGRMGRTWSAKPGQSLLCSFLLRPRVPRRRWPLLTLALALALQRSLARRGVPARIKWPNDVGVGGRKLAGILTEVHEGPGAEPFLVAGLGLNVRQRRADFPPELRDQALSLALLGLSSSPRKEEKAFQSEWSRLWRRSRGLRRAAWIRREAQAVSDTLGRRVRIRLGGKSWEGRAAGLGPLGELDLEESQGSRLRRISAGTLEYLSL